MPPKVMGGGRSRAGAGAGVEGDQQQASQPRPPDRGLENGVHSATTAAPPHRPSTSSPSPRKAKFKAPAKANVKSPSKPSSKPIYSFFNATVQRQQASQVSQSEEPEIKPVPTYEDIEIIHDDTDDETQDKNLAATTLSQGSSTALAMRKRKFDKMQSIAASRSMLPTPSQKFRKASRGGPDSTLPSRSESTLPWTERFPPASLSELAVHKRKVTDVREWLQTTFQNRRQRVLVLKGAAGTGKTTTVRLLAQTLGFELIEWGGSAAPDQIADEASSAVTRFEEFATRARSSAVLTLSSSTFDYSLAQEQSAVDSSVADRPRILLVEEFPSTFSRTSSALDSFRSTIAQFVSTVVPDGKLATPMIMIVSETLLSTNTAAADSFTAHRLLGPELINHPYVTVIEFNPVAPTFLVKALELVVVKEARQSGRRRTPGPQVLKRLAEVGDIRSAVSSLEFLCLRGDEGDTWSSKVVFTKSRHSTTQSSITESEEASLKLITHRESSLGIFHSVGKVVYNKRVEPKAGDQIEAPPPWLLQYNRHKTPETDADVLLDELGTDISTFISALHENYALSCSRANSEASVDSLLGCMEYLSDSDTLSLERLPFGTRSFSASATESLRQDEMCFQVAVRGILLRLPYPVQRGAATTGSKASSAYRMFYPASLRLWKKQSETHATLEHLLGRLAAYQKSGSTSAVSVSAHSHSLAGKFGASGSETSLVTDESEERPSASAQIRDELLMDSLPYMARILDSKRPKAAYQSLLDQMTTLTSISGATFMNEGDLGEPDGEEPNFDSGDQWHSDRADHALSPTAISPRKPVVARKHKHIFDAMAIPVETREEKLILEEDDIEDD